MHDGRPTPFDGDVLEVERGCTRFDHLAAALSPVSIDEDRAGRRLNQMNFCPHVVADSFVVAPTGHDSDGRGQRQGGTPGIGPRAAELWPLWRVGVGDVATEQIAALLRHRDALSTERRVPSAG